MRDNMRIFFGLMGMLVANLAFASSSSSGGSPTLGLTGTGLGLLAVAIFVVAYAFVMAEEFIHLPKSKPVIFAAGLIWILVAYLTANYDGDAEAMHTDDLY
jgi:hypothetical protein